MKRALVVLLAACGPVPPPMEELPLAVDDAGVLRGEPQADPPVPAPHGFALDDLGCWGGSF